MNEFPHNLWAPWRLEYIEGLAEKSPSGCFLCDFRDAPADDIANRVVWRTPDMFVVMNRFPYTNGHLLVAPLAHEADLDDLDESHLAGLIRAARDAKTLLTHVLSPHGFNIGINFGLCAGAGLPDHLHVHIVPRWNGDTNFMAVMGDVRVIPQALDRLCGKLREQAISLGLSPSGA